MRELDYNKPSAAQGKVTEGEPALKVVFTCTMSTEWEKFYKLFGI